MLIAGMAPGHLGRRRSRSSIQRTVEVAGAVPRAGAADVDAGGRSAGAALSGWSFDRRRHPGHILAAPRT